MVIKYQQKFLNKLILLKNILAISEGNSAKWKNLKDFLFLLQVFCVDKPHKSLL